MAWGGVGFLKEVARLRATSLIPSRQPLWCFADYRGWDDPIVLTFEDAPPERHRNRVEDQLETGSPVDGSTYIGRPKAMSPPPTGSLLRRRADRSDAHHRR